MGVRNLCCRCPEAWANFINRWVFVLLTNDDQFLMNTQWQLRQVQETYLVLRRPVADLDGWQRVAIPCQHIAALVEAPPRPFPPEG